MPKDGRLERDMDGLHDVTTIHIGRRVADGVDADSCTTECAFSRRIGGLGTPRHFFYILRACTTDPTLDSVPAIQK